MSRHAKEKSNLKKFLTSPFMDLMWVLGMGSLFGYVIAEALLSS